MPRSEAGLARRSPVLRRVVTAAYDDGIRLHGYAPEPMDKAGVRAFYEDIFRAFERPQLEFHEVLWSGDACAIRFTMSGRHVGEFRGVPATAPRARSTGAALGRADLRPTRTRLAVMSIMRRGPPCTRIPTARWEQ